MTATVSIVPVGPTFATMLPMSPLTSTHRPPHLSPTASCRKRSIATMTANACRDASNKRPRRLVLLPSSPITVVVNPESSSKPRRVHFQIDQDDDPNNDTSCSTTDRRTHGIHTEVFTFDRVPADCLPHVWWSKHELLQIRHRETTVLRVHRQCASYQHQLVRLLAVVCGKHPQRDYDSLQRDVLDVANCTARGLERQVAPCLRQREKLVRRNLLASQVALRTYRHKTQGHVASPQVQAIMLSEHARNLSRPARQWARLLAQGDAHWARVYQRATEKGDKSC